MKILICDDDQAFAERLESFLAAKLPSDVRFYLCRNREQLMDLLSEKEEYDLLLMDICLEKEDGIRLARTVLEQAPWISVIFITGYPDLFYETVYLTVRPWGFVRKPVNKELLLTLIKQMIQEREKNMNDWICLKTRDGVRKVSVSEVRYIESHKHMLFFHGISGVLESYGKLGDLSAVLPDYFFHCHKSFLVNGHYIRSYQGDRFLLDDGTVIGISQARRKEIRKKFFRYLDQKPVFHGKRQQ